MSQREENRFRREELTCHHEGWTEDQKKAFDMCIILSARAMRAQIMQDSSKYSDTEILSFERLENIRMMVREFARGLDSLEDASKIKQQIIEQRMQELAKVFSRSYLLFSGFSDQYWSK